MTKAIVYTTRAPAGREGGDLLLHYSMLEALGSIDMLTAAKTSKAKLIIKSVSGLRINEVRNLFSKDHNKVYKHLDDWMAVYNALDVSELKDYDNLVLIGGLDLWRSQLTRYGKRSGKFPHDRGQLKFLSCANHLLNILALLKAHREYNIPLHEVAFDPNEMSMNLFHDDVAVKENYHLYHGYDVPKYHMERIDTLQYCLERKKNSISNMICDDKTIDLFFGYNIFKNSCDRRKFVEWVDQVGRHFPNKKILVNNEYTGINTTVDKVTYLRFLQESKYTLILPAADENCFSVYRLIEALNADCLPIIHPDCSIDDINQSFGIDLSYLKTNEWFSESTRLVLLDELKKRIFNNLKSFKV